MVSKFRNDKVQSTSLESLGYIFVADSMGVSSFKFSGWDPKDARSLKQSA